jgi:anhydro-N-acetylmuramic acid kinase
MSKSYYSLGLMSGTSMDGVDASIIQSDGKTKYKAVLDRCFEYSKDIYENLTIFRDKIKNSKDLKKFSKELKLVEKEITLFHAKVVGEILKKSKVNVDFVGFHGQTIYHNAQENISKQLGDGKLLSKLTKKTVIYDFRQNDLKNGGDGAPLTPIFHKLIVNQNKITQPVIILNLGGIANWTYLGETEDGKDLRSADAGPGNCLIDQWMKKNSKQNYDKDGSTAKSGKINKTILKVAIDNYMDKMISQEGDKSSNYFMRNRSYDVKDFDLSFVHGLSLEDGAATLTEYTSFIISKVINAIQGGGGVVVCGGGRKNKFLFKRISKKLKYSFKPIENFGIDGDFIESQAFAYLAIRSYLNLPISFPETTGVREPCNGGTIIKNF